MSEQNYADKSVEIIKDAMKNVLAEFVIKLEDDSQHMVYITHFEIQRSGKIDYSFATLSEDRKNELVPHIETIFKQMLNESKKETKRKPFFK